MPFYVLKASEYGICLYYSKKVEGTILSDSLNLAERFHTISEATHYRDSNPTLVNFRIFMVDVSEEGAREVDVAPSFLDKTYDYDEDSETQIPFNADCVYVYPTEPLRLMKRIVSNPWELKRVLHHRILVRKPYGAIDRSVASFFNFIRNKEEAPDDIWLKVESNLYEVYLTYMHKAPIFDGPNLRKLVKEMEPHIERDRFYALVTLTYTWAESVY